MLVCRYEREPTDMDYYSLKHVALFRWGVFGCALGARAPHSLLVAPRVERRLQALLDALLCLFTRARCRALGVRPLRSLLVDPNVVHPIQYLLDAFCLLPSPRAFALSVVPHVVRRSLRNSPKKGANAHS